MSVGPDGEASSGRGDRYKRRRHPVATRHSSSRVAGSQPVYQFIPYRRTMATSTDPFVCDENLGGCPSANTLEHGRQEQRVPPPHGGALRRVCDLVGLVDTTRRRPRGQADVDRSPSRRTIRIIPRDDVLARACEGGDAEDEDVCPRIRRSASARARLCRAALCGSRSRRPQASIRVRSWKPLAPTLAPRALRRQTPTKKAPAPRLRRSGAFIHCAPGGIRTPNLLIRRWNEWRRGCRLG